MRILSPYTRKGRWYKGNVHCHSNRSDGELPPDQVVAYYRERGYDFLSITDHDILTDSSALGGPDFLCIPGEEASRPHMVALGITHPLPDRLGFAGQIAAIADAGGLSILAHPAWMGLRADEIASHQGMCGIEIFNYICHRLNGKGYSLNIWDELGRDKHVWGLAVDDSHFREPHSGGGAGWICVRAEALTQEAILQAIRDGDFYSSRGPRIHSVTVDGGAIRVECSPARHIYFIGQAYYGGATHAEEGEPDLIGAEYHPDPRMGYCRIEVLDADRRHAWTNPMWIQPH